MSGTLRNSRVLGLLGIVQLKVEGKSLGPRLM